MHTLKIKNLTVSVENQIILKDFNIEIKSGEIHAIMGPNGTGKSTLTKVIMGDKKYKIESGTILLRLTTASISTPIMRKTWMRPERS